MSATNFSPVPTERGHRTPDPHEPGRPDQSGPVRIALKPPGPVSGYVDGAWWPRSKDLVTESRPLLAAIAELRGPTFRINYDLAEWTNAQRTIMADGVRVHLDGFKSRPHDRVLLADRDNRVLTLLVIPPATARGSATDSMRRASTAGNIEDPSSLLAPQGAHPSADRSSDADTELAE